MTPSKAEQVARLVRKAGVFRPRELDRVGIPRQYLRQAKDRGLVRQVGRGLYVAEGSRVTEHHTLVEATKRVPHGVICLLSALRFYGLTTQSPNEVWMAIAHKARRPRADYPPMRIMHFSGEALSYGVKEKKLKGMIVRVFDPAKTVADGFKFRNIGLDVALETRRDCLFLQPICPETFETGECRANIAIICRVLAARSNSCFAILSI